MKICKTIIVIIILFTGILYLTACTKDKVTPPPVPIMPKNVTGKWKWFRTYIDYPLGPNNPLTPANTGNTESMEFYMTNQWKKVFNNSGTDSGTYTLEHGKYTNPSNNEFIYDQIKYNRNGSFIGVDWYEIHNDTLVFDPGFGGSFTSLNVPNAGGTKWFIKQ